MTAGEESVVEELIERFGDQAYVAGLRIATLALQQGDRDKVRSMASVNLELMRRGYSTREGVAELLGIGGDPAAGPQVRLAGPDDTERGTDDAFALLGVMMRREGRTSVTASWAELRAEPIQLCITHSDDGITISEPPPEVRFKGEELLKIQRQACETGKPVTASVRVPPEKMN